MKRNLVIVCISIIVIAVSLFFIFNSQTYSMLDIEADDYRTKLKVNENDIFDAQLKTIGQELKVK
jgi:hypothetical protein